MEHWQAILKGLSEEYDEERAAWQREERRWQSETLSLKEQIRSCEFRFKFGEQIGEADSLLNQLQTPPELSPREEEQFIDAARHKLEEVKRGMDIEAPP